MTADELELWKKIAAFPLDNGASEFKFSQRLAMENGWSNAYTQRVITEYRKFIFLCCVSETGVTPSDPVDQAWHLHLTYTRSYWVDLCKNTLNREIHHNPTKGGGAEAGKFDSFYTSSKDIYKEKFDAEPPLDIWHTNTERFNDINFQRVNLKNYWLVKKPRLKVKGVLQINALLLGAVLLEIYESTDPGWGVFFLLAGVIIITITIYRKESGKDKDGSTKNDADGNNGCSTSTDANGGDHHSHGHHSDSGHHGCSGGGHGCSSGCSSGCGSGCSSSH